MVWKEGDVISDLKKNANNGLLGFEDFFNRLISIKSNVNYPHYNIEKLDENHWCIVLAIAGFAEQDIEISLTGMQLSIKGYKVDEDEYKEFIYKGIANRSFQRSFLLAEGISIERAELSCGLLKIFLQRPISEVKTIKIPISKSSFL